MSRAFVLALFALQALAGTVGKKPTSAACLPDPCAAFSPVALYRAFDPIKEDHFYTTDITEIVTAPSYKLEGIAGRILSTNISGTAPLYRLFNTVAVDHLYTISAIERANYLDGPDAGTWVDEGIAGYLLLQPQCGTLPFSRTYKAAAPPPDGIDHFYTGDVTELIRAIGPDGFGYTWEAVIGFIWPA